MCFAKKNKWQKHKNSLRTRVNRSGCCRNTARVAKKRSSLKVLIAIFWGTAFLLTIIISLKKLPLYLACKSTSRGDLVPDHDHSAAYRWPFFFLFLPNLDPRVSLSFLSPPGIEVASSLVTNSSVMLVLRRQRKKKNPVYGRRNSFLSTKGAYHSSK